MRIEVAYSPRARSVDCVDLSLAEGSTAEQAVQASGLLERHPELPAPAELALGLHGRSCSRHARLNDGDRVEVYRPLRVDPKEARRERHRRDGKA